MSEIFLVGVWFMIRLMFYVNMKVKVDKNTIILDRILIIKANDKEKRKQVIKNKIE